MKSTRFKVFFSLGVILIIFKICRANSEHDSSISFDEMIYMNLSADPCDDFYQFSCGNFQNIHPIPDGVLNVDQFTILEDQLIFLANKILSEENQDNDPEALKKARIAYDSCISTEIGIPEPMLSPEVQVANHYGGFPLAYSRKENVTFSWNDIADLAADYGIPLFFSVSPQYDATNTSKNVLRIENDVMSLPEQIKPKYNSYDDIIEDSFKKFATKQSELNSNSNTQPKASSFELFLRKIVRKIRRIVGSNIRDEEVNDKIANISNFMKGIHFGGVVPEGSKLTELTTESEISVTLKRLNEWTRENLGNNCGIDWVEYVKRIFKYTDVEINAETEVLVYVNNTNTTLYGILNWIRMNDPDIVKSAAMLRVFVYMAADSDFQTRTDFNEYLKSIKKPVYPRWEYCTRKIADYNSGTVSLSFALTYEYLLRYFNTNILQEALAMISDLQASFKEIVKEATWMDDPSKEAALGKVDNMVTLLGFPEYIKDKKMLDKFYKKLAIRHWDNYGNSKNIRAFKKAYQLNLFDHRSRFSWEKSPFDVNAYYNRPNNRIIFPLAVLNPIFFGGKVSLLDYSRIGSIIGHEITHGFDAQGMLYDQYGNMNITNRWWTDQTTANFSNHANCFIEQYSKYPIEAINAQVDGSTTLNENLADNGGTRTSFRALQKLIPRVVATKGALPHTDRFSPEQLFFVGFATMWCSNESPAYLTAAQTCTSNCHSMTKWRVNGVVSNMAEFAKAFSCPKGTNMNPETKCKLW